MPDRWTTVTIPAQDIAWNIGTGLTANDVITDYTRYWQ